MSIGSIPPYSRVTCPECGTENRVKAQFGPYHVTKRYAIGGMSSVFSANDVTLNRNVALKILSEEYSKDEKRIAAFEDEARLTASFSHPNVVRIFTTGRAFGCFYIAMEFVPGGHFEHKIREKGKIPELEILPLAIQVAQGLKGAKSAGLIHRDIKPGNILFDAEGNAKIVDFGLALVTKGGEATAEEIWATPYYVPPEAIEGGAEDFRSDIYAFGATLYHALAGTPPCDEETMDTKLLRIAKTKVIPLKRIAPEISFETCAIIDRAMAYEAKDRFSSYDEMIASLRAAIKVAEGLNGQNSQLASKAEQWALHRSKMKKVYFSLASLAAVIVIVVIAKLILGDEGDSKSKQDQTRVLAIEATNTGGQSSAEKTTSRYLAAKQASKKGNYSKSESIFLGLFDDPKTQEPTRTWTGMEALVAALLDGRMNDAKRHSIALKGHFENGPKQLPQSFISNVSPLIKNFRSLPFFNFEQFNLGSQSNEEVLVCLIAGLKNWEQGGIAQAVPFFKKVVNEKSSNDNKMLDWYREIAANYLSDYKLLSSDSFGEIPKTANECRIKMGELERIKASLKTKGRARFNVQSRLFELEKYEKTLK